MDGKFEINGDSCQLVTFESIKRRSIGLRIDGSMVNFNGNQNRGEKYCHMRFILPLK